MDGLSCTAATSAVAAASFSVNKFLLFPSVSVSRLGVKRRAKRDSFRVFTEKEEPKFDKWDQMELKFGRMLGEDPKLTLAKVPFCSFFFSVLYFYDNLRENLCSSNTHMLIVEKKMASLQLFFLLLFLQFGFSDNG